MRIRAVLAAREGFYDEMVDAAGTPRGHARTLADENHVKVGHGRMYADVPPVKGVFRGAGGAELSASVRMTRADASPARG